MNLKKILGFSMVTVLSLCLVAKIGYKTLKAKKDNEEDYKYVTKVADYSSNDVSSELPEEQQVVPKQEKEEVTEVVVPVSEDQVVTTVEVPVQSTEDTQVQEQREVDDSVESAPIVTTGVDTNLEVSSTPSSSTAEVVYDGLTLDELASKLDRILYSTLSGKGYTIASYALSKGVDPYLALAIILHETGCSSGVCSQLVQSCYNVGGIKGSPSCGGGSYRAYGTIDEGIKAFIDLLYNNYISKGLTTAEAINPKYASSTTWAAQVNAYIEKIRAV